MDGGKQDPKDPKNAATEVTAETTEAPEPVTAKTSAVTTAPDANAGCSAGRVELAGGGLLVAGVVAVWLTRRRRRG